jgi:hypothetical protein
MSLRQPVQENRVICMLPPPFRQDCSLYKQASFSPTTIKLAERSKSILSMKIAKMILLGDCGVGKTALAQRLVIIYHWIFKNIFHKEKRHKRYRSVKIL